MNLSKIAAYLFHPVFMTIVGVFIIFHSGIFTSVLPGQFYRYVYVMVFICTIALPLGILPIMMYYKKIQDTRLDEKNERLLPLAFAMACFYAGYYMISKFSPSDTINFFLLSSVLVLFGIFIVSFFWKISMHMAGIGGVTGLILFLMVIYRVDLIIDLCVALLIAGIISSSRLASDSHSPLQLCAGYLMGFCIVFDVMMKVVH